MGRVPEVPVAAQGDTEREALAFAPRVDKALKTGLAVKLALTEQGAGAALVEQRPVVFLQEALRVAA